MKIQFKLNKRVFAVNIRNGEEMSYDELINKAYELLIEQINSNNETIHNIFFNELEVVCSECGISLQYGEDSESFKCLQCENEEVE